MICFLHLWLKFQKEHKTNLWLSRISSFESVVKVYVELPSELWMPNFLCSGSLHNVIYTQNNIVRGLVGCDNNLFVMEERRVFNNIWVYNYWCRASAHIPTSFLILLCISDLTLFTHSEGIYRSSFACFTQCLA